MKQFCLLGMLALSRHSAASACKRASPGIAEAYNASDVIFTGKAIEVSSVDGAMAKFDKVRFEIYKSYKVESAKQQSVVTNQSVATCGYPLHIQNEYLIYASNGTQPQERTGFALEGQLIVTMCSRTSPLKTGSTPMINRLKESINFLENVQESS
jgi:hypothetical protein